jgi:hypothetical protein
MVVSILIEAHELINGQRADDYGKASENFGRIARRWSEHLGVDVTPQQVCLCMIELKMCRLAKSPDHRDSWVDVAGYVGCKGKIEEGI